ncbi:MAG: 30S ribosomal protein S6 [Flavobacteriales bacterium]
MNRYETVFILTPVLSEEQAAETVEKFEKFLKNKGAKVKHCENWGLRKLAYPIQKKTTGFYHLFEFESEGEVIGPFETEFRRDERILRFLTTSMDKYHLQYAESRRGKAKEKKEKAAEAKVEA